MQRLSQILTGVKHAHEEAAVLVVKFVTLIQLKTSPQLF